MVTKSQETTTQNSKQLSAKTLRDALWKTLLDLQADKISVKEAYGIVAPARTILTGSRLQLDVVQYENEPTPENLMNFVKHS